MDFEYSLKEVRNNPTATNAFFLAYEKAFKVQIKGCKSCNLSGKLNELNRYLKGMGIKDLNNRMKVRYRETIFSYIDKESKRAVRRYGRNLTLEFIKGFKKNSTDAEMKSFASKFERLEIDGFDWVAGEAIEVVDLDVKEDPSEEDLTAGDILGDKDIDFVLGAEEQSMELDELISDEDIKNITSPAAIVANLTVADALRYIDTITDFTVLESIAESDDRKGVKTAIENALNK